MHILFLTDNFPPETNAPATRTFEHIKYWVKKGIRVTVITGAPNFPEGKIYSGYKNKWLIKENIDGIEVWRVKTYISANQGVFKRIIDFLSFMISSFIFGILVKNVSVVIGTSPQFFTVISAWALSKLKKVPFVFELRDIWPDSVSALGVLKNSLVIKIFVKIEIFLYHQSDLIISVTNAFKTELSNRGIDPKKIKVVLNGADLDKYIPISKKDFEFSERYNLSQKFVVGYVGTQGIAHELKNVIKSAEILKENHRIHFIFAGGGADNLNLKQEVKDLELKNVTFIPTQPKENMPRIWSLCDISLVHLKNSNIFESVIPSKIFESMAMGLPIIISIPKGEATNLVEMHNAGISVLPESPNDLAEKILDLSNNKKMLESYSRHGIQGAQHFNRKNLSLEMLGHIKRLLIKNS